MQRNVRSASLWVTGLILASLMSACQPVQPVVESGPETLPETASTNVIVEITDDSLNVPATIPAGIVTVTFQNNSNGLASPSLGWLAQGKTYAEFEAAMQSDDFATILQTAVPVGGPDLKEGESKDVIYDLKAGDILVVNFPEDRAPQIATSVAEESGQEVAAPKAEFKVEMDEFSFVMPDEVPTGPHLWQFSNVGEQWHEVIIFRPDEGATMEQFMEFAMMEEEPEGEIPFEEITFFNSMGAGTTAWATIDLPAGEYYVVCFLPDVNDEEMASHLHHGMIRTLVVK